jgi:CRP-like cAMP-binding protein
LRHRSADGPPSAEAIRAGVIHILENQPRASYPGSILARIDGGKSESRYQKDQIAYSQGDPADSVFYVKAGTLKVTVVSPEGKEAVVAIPQEGTFCGEECLSGHELRLTTVTALTDCVLIRMAKARVVRALHDDPEFSELFTKYLMKRNIRAQADLGDVPPIIGRSPMYVYRQLHDIKIGTRNGAMASLMKGVVEKLTDDDMIAIAAYLASRNP